MAIASALSPSAPSHAERLVSLRERMRAESLDLCVVRGTDRFLNEYVPTAESSRVWLTGFSGSTGDALVGLDDAWLFVDGRYELQAAGETEPALWSVETVPLGIGNERRLAERIAERARKTTTGGPLRVGFEPDRFSLALLEQFRQWVGSQVQLVPCTPSLVERARGPIVESRGTVRVVDESAVGRTVDEKIAAVGAWLTEIGADALLVQRLDELAYVTNLRGDELPYQATFRAVALVTPREVIVAVDLTKVPEPVRAARPRVRFVDEDALGEAVAALGQRPRIAVDPAGATEAMRLLLEGRGASVQTHPSPLTRMKARKTPEELTAMSAAFQRADRVVAAAQRWLIERLCAGDRISEVDFAQKVEALFRESGAVGLSFRVISAAGANAAVVHHPPDPARVIRRGEIVLLDTGAYYAEGYATDLTRTFFAGGNDEAPDPEAKRWFTLVLKAAIAGMTARLPRGANGAQLDGIVRASLWAAGYEYAHGTGHGVGINVHEFPPRVASTAMWSLEEGHVFSIEPGLYLAGRGGVRIENLCTVVADPDAPGFIRVQPMTFSPLDTRLIDDALLTEQERGFLTWFQGRYRA